jgi:hypothetical protein
VKERLLPPMPFLELIALILFAVLVGVPGLFIVARVSCCFRSIFVVGVPMPSP